MPSGVIKYISRARLRTLRQLGEGEFGKVYLGLCSSCPRRSTSGTTVTSQPGDDVTMVAIKALKRGYVDDAIGDFEREAELLSGMDHENIVEFYGISVDEYPLMLVLEYMENGDLNSYLRLDQS